MYYLVPQSSFTQVIRSGKSGKLSIKKYFGFDSDTAVRFMCSLSIHKLHIPHLIGTVRKFVFSYHFHFSNTTLLGRIEAGQSSGQATILLKRRVQNVVITWRVHDKGRLMRCTWISYFRSTQFNPIFGVLPQNPHTHVAQQKCSCSSSVHSYSYSHQHMKSQRPRIPQGGYSRRNLSYVIPLLRKCRY